MRSTDSRRFSAGSFFPHRGSRIATAFAGFVLFASASAGAQTMQFFGDWVAPGAAEIYVSTTGVIGNPGTLAQPLPSITSAIALASNPVSPLLGVVPVTINVLNTGTGRFDVFQGETFPIMLPAHGIAIEGYNIGNGPRPVVDATGSFSLDTFVFNGVGNPLMPDSVLRGLDIQNGISATGSTEVLISVPLGALPAPQRAAPEIRQCFISGTADIAVHMVSNPDVNLEAVLEQNVITGVTFEKVLPLVGVQVTGGDAPTSPLIRANQIQYFETNVFLTGGGLTNQPRVQANFIQVGETNVRIEECAPFIVGNTIAFAFRLGAVPAIGIVWVGAPTMTLANNLIWNPAQPAFGMTVEPADVVGSFAIFTAGVRSDWFNFDQDGTIVASSFLPNYGPGSFLPTPGTPTFVGGDAGAGRVSTDLHLQATSVMRDLGIIVEAAPNSPGFSTNVLIPGAPAPIVVRTDHAFDFDFGSRIAGITGLTVDLGADEVTALSGPAATSGTRAASLDRTIGSASGTDLDLIGNLTPTAGGLWSTDVDITGTPGDLVMLISGVGFFDFITDPTFPGAMIENTAVYQNLLGNGTILPGMVTSVSLAVDLFGGSVTVGIAVVPAGGVVTMNVNFGAANPVFFEAEAHLQAIAFDPSFTLVQTTNRLRMELNE